MSTSPGSVAPRVPGTTVEVPRASCVVVANIFLQIDSQIGVCGTRDEWAVFGWFCYQTLTQQLRWQAPEELTLLACLF